MNKYTIFKIIMCVGIIVFIPFSLYTYNKYQSSMSWTVEVDINDTNFNYGPYIYIDTGQGYNSYEVYAGKIKDNKIVYKFNVKSQLKGIRIDPMAEYGQFTLNKIKIINNNNEKIITFDELTNFFDLRDIESNKISDGIILKSLSNDPMIISKNTLSLNRLTEIDNNDIKKTLLLYFIIYFIIITSIFLFKHKINKLVIIIQQEHFTIKKVSMFILSGTIIAGYFEIIFILLSNIDNIFINYSNINYFYLPRYIFFLIWTLTILLFFFIEKKYIIKYRYIIVLILFTSLIIGKYNLSSFTVYENVLKEKTENYISNVILWTPKAIRSDEFLVEKPYYYAQINSKNKLEYHNYNLMLNGQDMVISAFAPVKNIVLLAKPELWGYLFLDADRAFSFYWWFKVLFFIMCAFEFFYYFTKNAKGALIAALILYFSPPIQWQFSQNMINAYPLLFLGVILFGKFLIEKNMIKHYLYLICLFVCIITFIMIMYPARQVLIGYTAILFIIYLLYKNRTIINKRHVSSFLLLIILTTLFIIQFYYNSSSAIHDMLNTTYPGINRDWGKVSYSDWFIKYFYNYIIPYIVPKISNQTELAQEYNFIIPFIFYLFIYIKKYKMNQYQKILLTAIILFMFTLILTPSTTISKYLLLKYTYAYRVYNHINFLAMVLLISFLLNNISGQLLSNLKALFLSGVSTLILYIILMHNNINFEQFSSSKNILSIFLISLIVYFLFGYLLLKNTNQTKKYALILLLFLSIGTTITVNPVNYGSSAIFDKVVTRDIIEYNRKDNTDNNKWIYIGSRIHLSSLLTYAGVSKIGGIYYYPDNALNIKLDPDKKYENILNKFIFMNITGLNNDNNSIIEPTANPLICTVNMPFKLLQELNVQYIISDNEIGQIFGENLVLLKYYKQDKLYMYKIVL